MAKRLFPVEVKGRGRVLLDVPNSDGLTSSSGGTPGAPTKPQGRRTKRIVVNPSHTSLNVSSSVRGEKRAAHWEDSVMPRPNWPDTEFPWRLRTEERAERAKEEEEARMKLVERFLDRDSDEEDGADDGGRGGWVDRDREEEEDVEVLPSAKWGLVYEDGADKPVPARRGRGKMVPLTAEPEGPAESTVHPGGRKAFFPSDPADARAALLAKKSVRALSYRHQKRQRERTMEDGDRDAEGETDDDEVMCVCHGGDDGRELVQCDACQKWYHLECIGIRSIADLGREEDPWYCDPCCIGGERSESSEEEEREVIPNPSTVTDIVEPTFAPTDDTPRVPRSYDIVPFFQTPVISGTLQDSPMPWSSAISRLPKTPTRGGNPESIEFDSGASASSWIDSSPSRHEPSTPQQQQTVRSVKVYTNTTPGPFDVDDTVFDPTSTPSRGIKFSGGPFATPKNNSWTSRTSGGSMLFQTPSKPAGLGSRRDSALNSRPFGGPGTLDDSAGGFSPFTYSGYGRVLHSTHDESPVRRKSADSSRPHRIAESQLPPRMHILEESPVVRSKGKERVHDRHDDGV